MLALVFALLALGTVGIGGAVAAMPETAGPLAARESTPPCSPECELITAPTTASATAEYEGGGPLGGFTPEELREAYGLPVGGGRSSTVAVIDERGDPAAAADLAVYRREFGLPECTAASGCFQQMNEYGEPRHPTSYGSWVDEISLDLDMVTASCPECRIELFEAASLTGLRRAIDSAVESGATVVTNSWNLGFEGGNPANSAICEIEICVSQAEEETVDRYLDHPGVPIIFSGGDYGYGPRFPADSPYVISVGGTRLVHEPESARGWDEEVWSNTAYASHRKGRGTGSGCSAFEAKPAWETDPACPNRVENDISADADPRSPVSIYDSYYGGWSVAGGTSASAPFVAGIEGLSSGRPRRLGAQAFWEAGEAGSLFDVAAGSDGACTPPAEDAYWCTAGAGFDAPTGWGTPDGPLILESPPTAAVAGVTAQTQTTAVLHGRVDNEGNPTPSSCAIQIARPETGFANVLASFPCEPVSIGGDGAEAVTATATGLFPLTVYAYRVEATNSASAPVFSSEETFLTSADPPAVEALGASSVGRTRATISGMVDNEGAFDGSTCEFEVTTADDPSFAAPTATMPCASGAIEEDRAELVSVEVSGLALNTAYLFRLEATNEGGGPSISAAIPFRTLPETPVVETGSVEGETTTIATVGGFVDNEGAPDGSSCSVEIAYMSSPELASPFRSIACDPVSVTGEGTVAITASFTGLSPATEYMFRVTAENAGGAPVRGAWEPVTTASEPVVGPEHEGGSGTGTVIVTGPPDEAELARLREASPPLGESTESVGGNATTSAAIKIGAARVRGTYVLLPVAVPGAGTLTVADPGAVRSTTARSIGAGSMTLRVPLTRTTLRRAGRRKLRLRLHVTFAPTGGTAAHRSVTVVLPRRA